MGSGNPLVSIIIPVYNGSDYLHEAIDSALTQTYPNMEVIVVNDGSDDNGATEKIALSYGDRIRYFSKGNGGVATALNLGVEQMRGDFFSWLSHDDLYLTEKIETQMRHIAATGKDRTILFGDYEIVNERGEVTATVHMDHEKTKKSIYNVMYGYINGCTILVPRICFEETGKFDVAYRTTQDYDLWYRMAKVFEFEHLSGCYVRYRVHSAQDTQRVKVAHKKEEIELYLRCVRKMTREDISKLECRPSIFYMKMTHRFRNEFPDVASLTLRNFWREVVREPVYFIPNLFLWLHFIFFPFYLGLREKLISAKRMFSSLLGHK